MNSNFKIRAIQKKRIKFPALFTLIFSMMVTTSMVVAAPGQQSSATSGSTTLDGSRIEAITGAKGAKNDAEGVFKVSIPRTDVKVTVDGQAMPPFMGLTSWAAFKEGGKEEAMVMGDLVLFQDEVNPVMSTIFDAGLDITALHNHFFFDEPKVYFMHIGGEGTVEKLAKGVRAALDRVKEIRSTSAKPSARFAGTQDIPTSSTIDAGKLDSILGVKGQAKDGMYKAVIGRTVKMPCGCEVGKEMGVNTWAAFMGDAENAIVDGDFVTFEGELQPVLRTLRESGINVVAIHNHMDGETPKTIFLHYWGQGTAEELAQGVRSALDAQKKAGAQSPASASAAQLTDHQHAATANNETPSGS